MSKIDRLKELVGILNQAGEAYYQKNTEIMSNFEYDKLYDELVILEKETGVVLSDSPTIHVGYEVMSQLPKEVHEKPMLSLDKTKDVQVLADFLGEHEGVLSWKLDGLTIVLTYRDGKLQKAVTRGNGEIGEVVTNNAKTFKNIPLSIEYQGELILRGEAVIKYSDFQKINDSIDDEAGKYKNPRNLCAGSVRQLSNEITARRNVFFFAFALIKADGIDFHNSVGEQFQWLQQQGFEVVEHFLVNRRTLPEQVQYFADKIQTYDVPSDGLVVVFDDIAYGQSLGSTAKFPRNGLAFKWKDELAQTTLKYIEWSPSRTGLINPVAVFEPVELEGTTVSRASVHNVSIVEELQLGEQDEILVYKANMIIPQIEENVTRSGKIFIPSKCPACGEKTEIRNENGVKTLICPNPDCSAKHIKRFTHFVSRNAMNIEGLSEETIKKFITHGFLRELADVYHLSMHKEEIIQMDGFKEKSYENLVAAIEKSRKVMLAKFIYSLGIANIGLSNAKMICRHFKNDFELVRNASVTDLAAIDGVGEVIAQTFCSYFRQPQNQKVVDDLLLEIVFEQENIDTEAKILEGQTFVITGSLEHFSNRNELKDKIEALGGKATGSVTKKTDYLINNDIESNSSKNKKAKELGVKIITEQDFIHMIS